MPELKGPGDDRIPRRPDDPVQAYDSDSPELSILKLRGFVLGHSQA